MRKVLILRPQPGADRTAERAAAMGMEPIVAPLFVLRPLDWVPPAVDDFDAVLLTSANAARLAGEGLTPFRRLPCYCVGRHSAAAAEAAGFDDLRIGSGNGSDLLALMSAQGVRRAFHPSGREFVDISHPQIGISRVPVYASEAAHCLALEARQAIEAGAVTLIHSPRAGTVFGALIGDRRRYVRIVAISRAAAQAAGTGWAMVAAAEVPRDSAMLELAAKLCQNGDQEARNSGE